MRLSIYLSLVRAREKEREGEIRCDDCSSVLIQSGQAFNFGDAALGMGYAFGAAAAGGAVLTLVVWTPFYRIYRRFEPQANGLGVCLLGVVFSTLMTAFWFLFSLIPLVGDFVHPAYSQVDLRPLIMFASAFGISGVLFCMSLCGFALFLLVTGQAKGRRSAVCWTALIVLLVATTYGTAQQMAAGGRFYQEDVGTTPKAQSRAVCIINGDESQTAKAFSSDRNYELVLWSEESIIAPDGTFLDSLIALSANQRVIGAAWFNTTSSMNQASLIYNGVQEYVYTKRHPVPFAEVGTIPGPGVIYSALTKVGNVAMAICFDLNFGYYISSALPKETDVLIQPSETWGAIGKFHARTNAVRSIEHGFLLMRCSSDSYSGVFHPNGEFSAFVSDEVSGDYEFLMPSHFRRVRTLYSLIGEAFAFTCCAFALVYLVFLFAMPVSVLDRFFGKLAYNWLRD